jgi:hypothetical protein
MSWQRLVLKLHLFESEMKEPDSPQKLYVPVAFHAALPVAFHAALSR